MTDIFDNPTMMNGMTVLVEDIPFTITYAKLYRDGYINTTVSINNVLFKNVVFQASDFISLKNQDNCVKILDETFKIINHKITKG